MVLAGQFSGGYAAARAALIAYVDMIVPEDAIMVDIQIEGTTVHTMCILTDGTRLQAETPMLTIATTPFSRLRTMVEDMRDQLETLRAETTEASDIDEVLKPLDERPDVAGLGVLGRLLRLRSRLSWTDW